MYLQQWESGTDKLAEDWEIQDNSGGQPESYLQTRDTGDGSRTQALLTTFPRPIGGMFDPNRRMLRGAKQGGPHSQLAEVRRHCRHRSYDRKSPLSCLGQTNKQWQVYMAQGRKRMSSRYHIVARVGDNYRSPQTMSSTKFLGRCTIVKSTRLMSGRRR